MGRQHLTHGVRSWSASAWSRSGVLVAAGATMQVRRELLWRVPEAPAIARNAAKGELSLAGVATSARCSRGSGGVECRLAQCGVVRRTRAGRPNAPYIARDWLTKLALVASGVAITTIPDVLVPALPPDVQHVSVDGVGAERRRLLLVRTPGVTRPETEAVALALRDAAVATRAARLASPSKRTI